jgi:outer membrane protein OmpA-like peptidoglycan-associated protein
VETAGVVDEDGSGGEASETEAGGDQLMSEDEGSAGTSTGTPSGGVTTQTSAQVTTTASVGEESSDLEPFVVPETADNPSGATQYAVMAGGMAVMRGWYPTEEQAQSAVADAAVIMGGMENVTDETQVDPRAEIRPDSFAVYLQDFILFEFDSAEITPEFYDFLGFPLFFMQNSPAATVTVVARTDARGSESYNLELATRRAEAVRDHWLANGGNADQIILDPRGEEDADSSADGEQAALDRRVELRVSGFLAG